MKRFPFAVLLIFSVLTVFFFTACGDGAEKCDLCVDGDNNGVCDSCGGEVEKEEDAPKLALFEDGVPTFKVVISKTASAEIAKTAIEEIKTMLDDTYGIEVDIIVEDSEEDVESDIEVLIGEVFSRGEEYAFDGHELGKYGYAVKIIGTKVVINGGSEDALIDGICAFVDDVLWCDDITNLEMSEDIVDERNDYRITSLKVNGTDMKGYTIAVNSSKKYYKTAAPFLQDIIYEQTGYWLDIVDIDAATSKSIVMKHVDGVTGDESFKVFAKGEQLVIECGFDNLLEDAVLKFTTDVVAAANGDVNFNGTVFTHDISVVYYEDFGAKGDGKTDDFFAIYNTHLFANECGQTVKASRNPSSVKAYYIFDTREDVNGVTKIRHIPIQTNTDWQGVKFIIDDTNIGSFSGGLNKELGTEYIFKIQPNTEHKKVKVVDRVVIDGILEDGLDPDTTHIDLKINGWDGPMMIIPYNSEHRVFRRKGNNYDPGEAMHEIIVIDENGNVSEETPIMFAYTSIDYIEVYKLDPSAAITVKNATIETLESEVHHPLTQSGGYAGNYKKRGIEVTRSYTTVENITHIITGGFNLIERSNGMISSNSLGMFKAAYANQVTFKDCVIPGRYAYGNGSSYNFGANYVNKIVLDRCIQSNFWVKVDFETGEITELDKYEDGAYSSLTSVKVNDEKIRMFWGVGATNYCKNMEYINSTISRFDAHAGLCNGKVINSNVNSMSITGGGDMIVENSKWYQYEADIPLIFTRADYGYYWNGDVFVKNTDAYLYDTGTLTPVLYILNHEYKNWYFGYSTGIPNVTLDNLNVYSTEYQTKMSAGYDIYLMNYDVFNPKMHLGDAGKKIVLEYMDADGNGFIDEPLFDANRDGRVDGDDCIDLDGDGKKGNTNVSYTDRSHWIIAEQGAAYNAKLGVTHPTCTKNVNIVKPPQYIKIINNTGGYVYNIINTAGLAISDGGWNRDAETSDNMGGFFGNTKFIYGDGIEDFFHGTNFAGQNTTKTFRFVKID